MRRWLPPLLLLLSACVAFEEEAPDEPRAPGGSGGAGGGGGVGGFGGALPPCAVERLGAPRSIVLDGGTSLRLDGPTQQADRSYWVALWIRPARGGAELFGTEDAGAQTGFSVSLDEEAYVVARVHVAGAAGRRVVTLRSPTPVPMDEWTHLAFVVKSFKGGDSNEVRERLLLFVDGFPFGGQDAESLTPGEARSEPVSGLRLFGGDCARAPCFQGRAAELRWDASDLNDLSLRATLFTRIDPKTLLAAADFGERTGPPAASGEGFDCEAFVVTAGDASLRSEDSPRAPLAPAAPLCVGAGRALAPRVSACAVSITDVPQDAPLVDAPGRCAGGHVCGYDAADEAALAEVPWADAVGLPGCFVADATLTPRGDGCPDVAAFSESRRLAAGLGCPTRDPLGTPPVFASGVSASGRHDQPAEGDPLPAPCDRRPYETGVLCCLDP